MSKDNKMMDLMGYISSKYIDEATHTTKLSSITKRRFSLGNIAAVVVGLVAISFVTLMAFWLSGNLGEHPIGDEGNGYDTVTPTPTSTPVDDLAHVYAAAQELLLQYPTIFLNIMTRHTGLETEWDHIRSYVDYTGVDYLWTFGPTQDESYLMDGVGNIITDAPFLIEVDGPAIASRYFLFDEGDGVPLIIIDFHPYWIGSGRSHVYRFDGEAFVPIDSTNANWYTGGGGIESISIQPFVNDAGDLILSIQSGMDGRLLLAEDGQLRVAGIYAFDMEYEWADHVIIWEFPINPYEMTEIYARLTRDEFEAYRQSPAFFDIFPNMPEGDFRVLAPMPDLHARFDADIYRILREQTPESTLVATPPPTPNPRTEYIGIEDDRDFDYFMAFIRETGINIVTEPQYQPFYFDGVGSSMWFNGEYWVATMYEFESVHERVLAFDRYHFWRGRHSNGRFVMETNHPWLGEFFEEIP